jgi:RES domain
VRCHDSCFGATEFNPGRGHGRFHPFRDSGGRPVPTLYGASDLDGSLAESVFHNVPLRGPARAIRRSALRPMLVSTIAPRRQLTLVQLHGHGLGRLGVSRAELIDTGPSRYARTGAWAAALHARVEAADGLVWVSRRFDTAFVVVLFGDRLSREDLEVAEAPLPLFAGTGYAEVERVAELAGVTILTE